MKMLLSIALMTIAFIFPANAETRFDAFVTAYTWWDNTPPGSSTIAYPKIMNGRAGGLGTYKKPITLAVGHVKNKRGVSTPDFKPGTRFYIPHLKAYFIVEDLCGDGPTPQKIPCHTGYKQYGENAKAWLDVWIDGRNTDAKTADDCARAVTGVVEVIMNPKKDYEVISGPIYGKNGCRGSSK